MASTSPYAGEQGRDIKALSAEQVADLLAGKGMGFAKAAELNGYPGPRHVIELAEPLALSGEQLRKSQELFAAMQARAIDVGRQLVDAERQLDGMFHSRKAAPESLAATLTRIGALQSELRRVHLQAHLDMTALLSTEQLAKYAQLRGYGSLPAEAHPKQHEHSHVRVSFRLER